MLKTYEINATRDDGCQQAYFIYDGCEFVSASGDNAIYDTADDAIKELDSIAAGDFASFCDGEYEVFINEICEETGKISHLKSKILKI